MSSFTSKFSEYTMSQLNEILEDDEKLTNMIQEMDEVSETLQCCLPLATDSLFSVCPFVVLSFNTACSHLRKRFLWKDFIMKTGAVD